MILSSVSPGKNISSAVLKSNSVREKVGFCPTIALETPVGEGWGWLRLCGGRPGSPGGSMYCTAVSTGPTMLAQSCPRLQVLVKMPRAASQERQNASNG